MAFAAGLALVAVRAIHRKLVGDLLAARGQALAIGLVLMAGVAMF
jgi:hypothetical protein